MNILVTGVAGFIGFHVTNFLLNNNYNVIGIDNLNNYYEPKLKNDRLKCLTNHANFKFYKIDISNIDELSMIDDVQRIDYIIHLAAQAGVRYSLTNPLSYGHSNLIGHLNLLELARRAVNLQHFVYASSSSVYGANEKHPFSVTDEVNQPMSLYAATKRSAELMSTSYSHLFNIPCTGLRFFTVYGPWGRPDMSAFIFTKSILERKPIPVFNMGFMRRNFTYIDDILQGIIQALNHPPKRVNDFSHKIYNIGNNRTEELLDFIKTLENILGIKADLDLQPMQPGDVKETIADISDSINELGFLPKTNMREGLQHFVNWYLDYYDVKISKERSKNANL